MKIEVEEVKLLDEGVHEGVIIKVEYRTSPFNYTDVIIETEDTKAKAGYPTSITEGTSLGQLLIRFGNSLKVGELIDPDVLIGEKCKFLIAHVVTKDKGTFGNVIGSSVKPINAYTVEAAK